MLKGWIYMNFNVLDLFCGAGGLSAGLDQVRGIKTVIGVDFDKYAIETFNKNFPDAIGIIADIRDEKSKKDIIRLAREKNVNMIVGGPPCQGFSLKGKNLGMDDPRNFLFLEYYYMVEKIRPEIFVIENVKNILNSENGYFKNQIIEKFSSLGYIINLGVLNAKNYGVPESRERAIIIGSLSRSISLPAPITKKYVTVRDAISDLSYLNSGEGCFESEYKYEPLSDYQKQLRDKKLYNHQATNHSKFCLEKLAMIPPEGDKKSLPEELHGKQKFATTWSRLKWDDVSPTVDTRFDTPSNGRNSHPILNRAITPREAARIQSFPDSFIFYGPKTAVCKQIGNAVPPLLARAIGQAVKDAYTSKREIGNNYKIYCGDAYDILQECINENIKVDHIITDPPYNISKKNNFSTMSNSKRQGIDFGEWDKGFNLYDWIGLAKQIIKANGSIIIFCSYRFLSHFVDKLEENEFVVKDVLIWKKKNPMPRNIDRRYVQDTEFAIWAVNKNAKWIFNKPKSVSYLRSMFETATVAGKEKTIHPTQKSEKLMSDIIKIHTNKDDVILDPFMGSGTTGVSALLNKRKFIGIEIDESYYKIAKDRLKESSELLDK